MTNASKKLRYLWRAAGAGLAGMLLQGGCGVDPDIILRAAISAGSDTAIFLLQNLAVGI